MSLLVIYRRSERGRRLEQLEDFGCVRIKISDAPTPPPPPLLVVIWQSILYSPPLYTASGD